MLKKLLIIITFICSPAAMADDIPPIPTGKLNADQVAEQTFISTRGGLTKTAVSKKHGRDIALLINRAPIEARRRNEGRKPSVNLFETYVNNEPQDPEVDSMQMAVIVSGQVKGTGVLFVNYKDKNREPSTSFWLPALRKIRTMGAPSHEDTWAGSNLTYGELILRRPEHEVHELLGEGTFEDCLPVMQLEKWEQTRYTRRLPKEQCGHKGTPVYHLKSTTKFKNWWYDYHISDIDKHSFALYRTVYYKDGKKIKTVVVDWQSLDQPDPRITFPRFVYAITHENGRDSMIYVPRSTITLNEDLPDSFWSVETLKTFGRK